MSSAHDHELRTLKPRDRDNDVCVYVALVAVKLVYENLECYSYTRIRPSMEGRVIRVK